MKKTFLLISILLLSLAFNSCEKDDDPISIVGTVWFGTGNDSEEIVTFNNKTELKWSGGEMGTGIILTYTFDGSNGNMDNGSNNFNFSINGKSLIIYNGDESTFIKQ
jgi:hypothetical protein